MPHHTERPPGALAKGPAKPDDIARTRDALQAKEPPAARAERRLGAMEAAADTMREDVRRLKEELAAERRT